MSHTNDGAAAILEAGLFSAVRDSQLFATDPDIGLDVDNVEALENFYRLLISMLRILTTCVISRGSRNQHVIAQGKAFLTENRQCMQGVFKAAVREGPQVRPSIKQALEDLVGCFSALVHATDFVEVSSPLFAVYSIQITDVCCRVMKCRCPKELWAMCLLEDEEKTR
jgi:nuclear pore complex protein Nup205